MPSNFRALCATSAMTILCLATVVTPRHIDAESKTLSSRVVKTRYGSLRGFVSSLPNRLLQPTEVFLGVPYAGAPRGPLRFMPPVTSPHWKDVRLADHLSPVCPQKLPDISNETEALTRMPLGRYQYLRRLLPYLTNQSEDCLYLNIYVPLSVAKDGIKVPIMVYIHGESYEWNSGNPYDGRVLASFGDVIVITLNFRLGILGFLPAVDKSARGNYGLMDQVAALHWIQENMAEFGGDTDNVTIFGHGHGAACVNLLMLSPMARGLFHRAIMQSGSALSPWAIAHGSVAHTHEVARTLDCPYQDNTALVECLRRRDLRDIMDIGVSAPEHLSAFGPTVDGILLPADPAEVLERGGAPLFAQYDLMFGCARVESVFQFSAEEERFGIEAARRDRVLRTLVRNVFTYHLQEIFLTIVNEYMDWSKPVLHAQDIFEGTLDALGDATVVAPIIRAGSFHSGGIPREYNFQYPQPQAPADSKSYFYVFGYQTEFGDYDTRKGCVSGEDLPYVFGAPLVASLAHFSTNYTKAESTLSEMVMTQWTNFAKYGNPNLLTNDEKQNENLRGRYEKITWPEYEPVHQNFLSINMKPRVRDHYHAHRLSYWLNLIPRLHTSGDANVSVEHHRLKDHDNNLTYDGTVRNNPALFGPLLPRPIEPWKPRDSDPRTDLGGDAKKDGNSTTRVDLQETELVSKLDRGNSTLDSGRTRVYSTALVVTIAVGCALLVLNLIIFFGIYYQKEKDRLEKKLHKNYFQGRRSDDDEGANSGEKPFLVKDLSSSMVLNQYCSQSDFDGSQTLDLVQPSSKAKHHYQQAGGDFHLNSRTPQGERGVGLREAQPLLTPPSANPHAVTAAADCLQGWQHAQELSV